MADIALTSAPVVWTVANQIAGSVANGANGYVEFEASTVAYFHGGLTVLPSPQRAEVIDGEMTAIELPVNDPEVWNWKVTPHVGVNWPSFHVNVPEGGTDLSSAAVTPGIGPVRVLQGPQGGSVVGAEDQGDGTIRFVLDDGTRTDPMPITRGPAGPANKIEIGTVLRGDEPYAALSGAAPNQVLNLVLPKGDPGDPEDLVDATPEKRGLMAADDKAHLDLTPTRTEVEYEIHALDRNFEAIEPRYVTRPNVRVNNVIQSIGRTRDGRYFIAQRVSTSNDLEISRCDAGGRVIDSSVLLNGGHGASVGLEEQADGVYLWVWWDGKSDGARNALKRWKYVGGRDVPVGDPGVETMPDFGSSKPGFRWAGVNINQQLDLIAINNRTVDGDNIEVCRFSDYVAGQHTVLGTLPTLPLSEHGAFQGMVATEEYCYVLRGTGGLDAPHADRAHLDQFRWSTGEKVFTKELAYLTYLGRDGMGKSEPDGMCAWYDDAGRLSLLFAIETNTGGGNLHNIYSVAPADFQADTGAGAAMQLMFSPLNWVNVPLKDGFEYRASGWELQVAKDPHGMVHLRGHMANTGLTKVTEDTTIATLPREYWPEVEVRWIGYATMNAANPWGGWIRTGNGTIVIQRNPSSPDPGPTSHFCIIAQPWQTRA